MNCHFVVGQKVVCVDDTLKGSHPFIPVIGGLDGLAADTVYTVRDIYFDCGWCGWAIRLEEIHRPNSRLMGEEYEAGYATSRFRPVVERKTDISIFKAMLNPTRSAVPA